MRFRGPLAQADHFECDGAVEAFLARAINYALAASADFLQQFVIAKVSKHLCAERAVAGIGDAGAAGVTRPRLQVRPRADQDRSRAGKPGRLPAVRQQEFPPRTFRKRWWQSSFDGLAISPLN